MTTGGGHVTTGGGHLSTVWRSCDYCVEVM